MTRSSSCSHIDTH